MIETERVKLALAEIDAVLGRAPWPTPTLGELRERHRAVEDAIAGTPGWRVAISSRETDRLVYALRDDPPTLLICHQGHVRRASSIPRAFTFDDLYASTDDR